MKKPIRFLYVVLPFLYLALNIAFGVIVAPLAFNKPAWPLEIIFLNASVFAIAQLLLLGLKWTDVKKSIVAKIAKGLPAIFILLSIGVIIGAWIVSGTIPMLVYYGIKLINPTYIYAVAFIVPITFSIMTGTSWGSIGTIGVVLIGVGQVIGADLGIVAGAIVGGSYFGDKMSPLSDTTNLAAIASEVDLYEHIRSMMYTTMPSAILALIVFFCLGYIFPVAEVASDLSQTTATLEGINALFNFNILLLLPPLLVLYGAIKKLPPLPMLWSSIIVAVVMAFIFQDYGYQDIITSIHTGFDIESFRPDLTQLPENLYTLLNRGGLLSLTPVIYFTLMVFVFIGSLDVIDAIPIIVKRVFGFIKNRTQLVISTLFASGMTNSLTSNQQATSFIVGDAFKTLYDKFGLSRSVLSRSIEDYGTMIETLVPWTASAIFVTTTLGVSYFDYWHWQLLSLFNIIIAPLLVVLGIGMFKAKNSSPKS